MQAVGAEHDAARGDGAGGESCGNASEAFQAAGADGGCAEHTDCGVVAAEEESDVRAALKGSQERPRFPRFRFFPAI